MCQLIIYTFKRKKKKKEAMVYNYAKADIIIVSIITRNILEFHVHISSDCTLRFVFLIQYSNYFACIYIFLNNYIIY